MCNPFSDEDAALRLARRTPAPYGIDADALATTVRRLGF
jgi:hypothetical protein